MGIKIDWNSVEDKDFSPIPEGRYTVEIVSVKDTKNKDGKEVPLTTSKGDDMWSVQMKVVGPKYAGRMIFTNLIFNEGGYGNIKKLYSTIFGTKLPKQCDTTDLEGEKVDVDVAITEYNGKSQNSIPYAAYYKSEDNSEEEFE